ncbi:P2 response regulator binding domain-containing protein [Propionispira arboris]|uniref:P2 response regulator binding domain-containing protein n=1 Tax=Propionispira arboris TaxID=84035 RepID=A0A1H7ALV5_9FIRM|nr:P2 response regulator binding domain-containing protein [Propionispira arboris]
MDTNQYMEMFLEESREHLQSLNDCLLELEHNPEDAAVLNEIFRSAHTIKGMSATMGFTEIAELTHEMENVLDLLRKEQLKADEDIVDTIFKCVDTLEQMIENVAGGENGKVDVSTLVNKLNAIANGEAAPKAATVSPADSAAFAASVLAQTTSNQNTISLNTTDLAVINSAHISGLQAVHITVTLAESCLLKSARAYMVMNALDEVGEVVKSVPPADDLEQEKFEHSFDIVFLTGMETKKLKISYYLFPKLKLLLRKLSKLIHPQR